MLPQRSEKFQVRTRDWNTPDTLAPFIARLNEARRAHPALQTLRGTRFHHSSKDELLVYSRAVAGSIGRICVGIFGASDLERAIPLADDLGVAMQITNVLRDVREDFERGRVYLPAEDLARDPRVIETYLGATRKKSGA